ncbi:hypothetical protein PBI_GRAYSON_19 [Rhodococcus phage Grayson]|nr:hypothetical protein PBI_GRAYSON_19 [Rhodococcus phage Grayson]
MNIESTKATLHLDRNDISNLRELIIFWENEHPHYDWYDGDDHWELRNWINELKQGL